MRIDAVVIVVSDSRSSGARRDLTGPAAAAALEGMGIEVVRVDIVPDAEDAVARGIRAAAAATVELIVTAGGTGLAPRDVTPEATKRVIEREVPGIPEMLRQKSGTITPRAALSRGIAGILGRSLVINLPGSPKAVTESLSFLAPVLPHAIETLRGDAVECGGNKGPTRGPPS